MIAHVFIRPQGLSTTESTGTDWLDRLDPKLIEAYERLHPLCNIKQVCEDEILAVTRWGRLSKFTEWIKSGLICLYLLLVYLFGASLWYAYVDGVGIKKAFEMVYVPIIGIIAFIVLLHLFIRHLNGKMWKVEDEMNLHTSARNHLQDALASLGAFTRNFFFSDDLCWHHKQPFGFGHILTYIDEKKDEIGRLSRLLTLLKDNPDMDEAIRGVLEKRRDHCNRLLQATLAQIGLFGIEDEKDPDLFAERN